MNEQLIAELAALPGWCDTTKMRMLYDTIIERKITYAVEIGVYGGRSLFPMAFAMKQTNGLVIGIDPWDYDSAVQQGYDHINEWAKTVDFDALYNNALVFCNAHELTQWCAIYRTDSRWAHRWLADEIELLHIDGNHGAAAVLEDVNLYLPKVVSGGLIWFDDMDWPGVSIAAGHAVELGCRIYRDLGNNRILEKL